MYVHTAFRIDNLQAFAFLRERAFGTLIVSDHAGRPAAVHLPFLSGRAFDDTIRVELHVARANRLHELDGLAGGPALLICEGPDAYISPDWYGVPTRSPPGPMWRSTSPAPSAAFHRAKGCLTWNGSRPNSRNGSRRSGRGRSASWTLNGSTP